MADVMVLTDASFEGEVLESDKPVLVDFWATWCGPCRAVAPVVEEIARDYQGRVKFGKLDIDAQQRTPQSYGIMSIPTLLLFKGGKVVDQIVGAVPRAKIEQMIKKHLQ